VHFTPCAHTAWHRHSVGQAAYETLFGRRDTSAPDNDRDLGEILRRSIFGEVFHTGDLDEQTRELIAVVILASMQMLPQLKAHTAAALNVGVTPIELREAVYQCAPFIGFPATLNAVATINDVFSARGIDLPLPSQRTVDDEERHDAGQAIQQPIYGDEIRTSLSSPPNGLGDDLARYLTELCFGDFYTRTGLDLARRELLVLCVLAALGGTDAQLRSHAVGNTNVGNDKTRQVTALIHCFPYIGFPRALNAIRIVNDAVDPSAVADEAGDVGGVDAVTHNAAYATRTAGQRLLRRDVGRPRCAPAPPTACVNRRGPGRRSSAR
jgi:4-carboxymuconolactone decarboxylase